MKLIDYKELDFNLLEFKTPEKIKGSFISLINYNDSDIFIKTPLFKYTDEIIKTESKTFLNLEFDEYNIDFYNFLCNLDEFMIKKINENSLEWFGKVFPVDVIEEFFTSILKHKHVPKIKINVPSNNKNTESYTITDTNNNKIETFKNNEKISVILKFIGLKFLKQKVISEWSVQQIISDYELEENLTTDNIDLEIENYLEYDDKEKLESEDENEYEENVQDENTIDTQKEFEDNKKENENSFNIDNSLINKDKSFNKDEYENNFNSKNILELTQEELNKYKTLLLENENKFNELKQNIKNCLDL